MKKGSRVKVVPDGDRSTSPRFAEGVARFRNHKGTITAIPPDAGNAAFVMFSIHSLWSLLGLVEPRTEVVLLPIECLISV